MNTISAVAPLSPETTSAPTYPTARKVEQTDDYFGTTVNDPYRWMEDVDSAELKTWVDAELSCRGSLSREDAEAVDGADQL
jgi:prolyl oligopeptidase